MAAFTNQFSQQSPFDLPLRPEFFSWPSQIAAEATELVSCKDITWLSAVALQLESIVSKAAASPIPNVTEDLRNMKYFASLFRDIANIHPSVFRDMYGDFNLLMEGHDSHDWSAEAVKSSKADRFLVFCLWKLVDANTELHSFTFEGDMQKGGAYTIEAMRALQVAQSIKFEEQVISARNRENGVLANPNAEVNRLRALEMAEELPFRSMSKAAEHIADNLVKGTTKAGKETFYGTDWIKDWLRDAGWKPQHKRKTPQ